MNRHGIVKKVSSVVAQLAIIVATAGVVIVTSVVMATAAVRYYITDLGTLGGTDSQGWGINNTGQVTGESWTTGDTAVHAFLYSGGTMKDLGTLPGDTASTGSGINNAGQVTGNSIASDGFSHAFLYSGGTMKDLGTLGGAGSVVGTGINNAGQVTGYSYTTSGDVHAFIYSGGTMYDLGTLQGGLGSLGYGINDAGQVTGNAGTNSGEEHAFLYSGGTMKDLGTLGGTWSVSNGINNAGQVVGESGTNLNAAAHAFLYSGETMKDLGTLGGTYSLGKGINNAGQVVGDSGITGNAAQHAFIYSGGSIYDLNDLIPTGSGWTLGDALGINDSGQITGIGEINGQERAFLMTPIKSEIGTFRKGVWNIDKNGNYIWDGCGTDGCYEFGRRGDVPVAGDWNGDGKPEIGVFRDGMWHLDYNGNGVWDACGTTADTDRCYKYGREGDIPVVGDWNGDGKAKIGYFRHGHWRLDFNGDGKADYCGSTADRDRCYKFGKSGDKPVVGDWNGDGKAKIGVFGREHRQDYLKPFRLKTEAGQDSGCETGDGSLIADWDEDGKSGPRNSQNGWWRLDYNGDGVWNGCGTTADTDRCYNFGKKDDVPVVGDWSGDGKTKIGIFDDGLWHLDYTGEGTWSGCGTSDKDDRCYSFGDRWDTPVTFN